jgi:hypothetical protein
MSFDDGPSIPENGPTHQMNPVTETLTLACAKHILLGDIMKLNSALAAVNPNSGNRHFSNRAAAIGRGRLDTAFHVLLLAAGIGLSAAAAVHAAIETQATEASAAQVAANHRGEIRRFTQCVMPQTVVVASARVIQRVAADRS